MAAEQTLNNREILDATQNAVIDAAGSVVQVVENVEHEISGHGGAFMKIRNFGLPGCFRVGGGGFGQAGGAAVE